MGKQMAENFKKNMVTALPQAASNVLRNYIEESLKSDKNSNNDSRTNVNVDPNTAGDKELQAAINRKRMQNTYNNLMNESVDNIYKDKYYEQLAKDVIQNSSWDDMKDYNGKRYKWK
jgi:hypothetical protein